MKKYLILIGCLLVGQISLHAKQTRIDATETIQREAVTVSISVTSNGVAVKGAFVKITTGTITIGAGMTDDKGVATISIATYGKQISNISVTHAMYRDEKMIDQVLENGRAYTFALKSKGESAEEVTTESNEKIKEIEEKTQRSEQKTAELEKEALKLAIKARYINEDGSIEEWDGMTWEEMEEKIENEFRIFRENFIQTLEKKE